MNKFLLLGIVLVGTVIIIAGWVAMTPAHIPTMSFDAPTTKSGDFSVDKNNTLILKNGAKLTVEGKFEVHGKLKCDGGALNIVAKKDVVLDGTITCDSSDGSGNINLVVGHSLTLTKNSIVVADGNIQMVEGDNLLVKTAGQVHQVYDDIGKNTGGGKRIGPIFSEGAQASNNSLLTKTLTIVGSSRHTSSGSLINVLFGLPVAQATSHTVVIGGVVNVPTPPPGVHRIVVFNFPTAVAMKLQDLELTGPDGRDGTDDINKSCNANGTDGENAFRLLATAPNIAINNVTLNLGNGGNGGNAETIKDCDPGVANGGKGGQSGNFKIVAGDKFAIEGALVINPGNGGKGGSAIAHGKQGAPSQKGGDAVAHGGRGADNKKKLAVAGEVSGVGNVEIGSLIGGDGADATADPGNGGDGISCGAKGGPGGHGSAVAGKGGDAQLTDAAGAARAGGAQDKGGNGGNANSHGGKGGNGGSCPPNGKAGDGGAGGNAKSTKGNGGTGTSGNGVDGKVTNETGGNGGNGGDGCPPGNGGTGGAGNPKGKDGKPGNINCVYPNTHKTTIPPSPQPQTTQPPATTPKPTSAPTPSPAPSPTPPSPSTTGKKTIQVISYRDKYLPVQELIVENEAGCGENHWHAATGTVKATDGSLVPDPGPQCGYGKLSQTPVMQVQVEANFNPQP